MTEPAILCADVGSTYTKVAAVGTATGRLYGTAAHATTLDTDVLYGLSACRERIAAKLPPDVPADELRVCSSAGGGLRVAVIGNEPLVTATAARRAALSAGARVVAVAAGAIDAAGWRELAAAMPDLLLLSGGTDGGDTTVLIEHARQLTEASTLDSRLRVPVVFAGNADAAGEVTGLLAGRGSTVIAVDNVLPRIGQLRPSPARAALRAAFLDHVIAGKRLSADARFAAMVAAATPDAVLAGVELLADGHGDVPGRGDLVVVDVGGATTDVYSVLTPDAELSGPRREVAGTVWRSRTVEGDLGVRHTAPGIVTAARAEHLLAIGEADRLRPAADRRAADPALPAATAEDAECDLRLTELAAMVAMRRHARGERLAGPDSPLRGGKDLRAVRLVVGSGGVLRSRPTDAVSALTRAVSSDTAGGYPLPRGPRAVIDVDYVLAAAGLLAADHPRAAARLLSARLPGGHRVGSDLST